MPLADEPNVPEPAAEISADDCSGWGAIWTERPAALPPAAAAEPLAAALAAPEGLQASCDAADAPPCTNALAASMLLTRNEVTWKRPVLYTCRGGAGCGSAGGLVAASWPPPVGGAAVLLAFDGKAGGDDAPVSDAADGVCGCGLGPACCETCSEGGWALAAGGAGLAAAGLAAAGEGAASPWKWCGCE